MKPFSRIYALIVISLLSSCDLESSFQSLIPEEESQFAEEYISRLRDRDFEYVKSLMSDELLAQIDDQLLNQMADHFHQKDPISVNIIGSQVNIFNGDWQGNFTFEYEFEDGYNLANAAFRVVGDSYEINGLNVYQTNASQKDINRFSLSAKSIVHYISLFFAVSIPMFIIVTLVTCVLTPIPRRKWAWILFTLLGVGSFQLNWTTGQFALQLLSVNLLGAGIMASGPYSPWILSFSFPLGAVWFWTKRKSFLNQANEANKQSKADA